MAGPISLESVKELKRVDVLNPDGYTVVTNKPISLESVSSLTA
jgi:hypothetical protein